MLRKGSIYKRKEDLGKGKKKKKEGSLTTTKNKKKEERVPSGVKSPGQVREAGGELSITEREA